MRLDLLIITGECYIKEVFVFSELTERDADVTFEVIPTEAEFFVPHLDMKVG